MATDPLAPLHAIFAGSTMLVARANGDFDAGGDEKRASHEGLFERDCRMLSRHATTLNGVSPSSPVVVSSSPNRTHSRAMWRRTGGTAAGPLLPEDSLELDLVQRVGAGLVEDVRISNHSAVPFHGVFRIELDADFRDPIALTHDEVEPDIAVDVVNGALRLVGTFAYHGRTHRRATLVSCSAAARFHVHGLAALEVDVDIDARASFALTVTVACESDGDVRAPSLVAFAEAESARERWHARRAKLTSTNEHLDEAFATAADDLFALRMDRGAHAGARDTDDAIVVQAGAPSYTGLFGRDVLTASWQGSLLGPEMLRGALDAIAAVPGVRDDPFRDEEPGRLLHEARTGPLSVLGVVPQIAYYGSATTPKMFVVALSEAWHCTAERALLEKHVDTARNAIRWSETYGDLDGDGLLEYETRSSRGLKNQGWKDSDEAIRHDDGSLAHAPMSTLEEQAYLAVALERMAEIEIMLENDDAAAAYSARAIAMKKRIHERFWLEDKGFYAMALDAEKRPVTSIGSNAIHALAAGVVPPELAARVADRLLAPDLWTGFGVRTLSSLHPSYNPRAYHLGAAWPVEAATLILGLKRYGLDDRALTVAEGLLAAASAFPHARLPEALTGHARVVDGEVCEPSAYPAACWPQAWSASAVVFAVQALLGLYPFAPMRSLFVVHPRVPRGVDELRLDDVRVGAGTATIRFVRYADDGRCHVEVLAADGVHVVHAAPPVALDATMLDRVRSFAIGHAPGRRSRAARLALGLHALSR